jgi:hypothetical protein
MDNLNRIRLAQSILNQREPTLATILCAMGALCGASIEDLIADEIITGWWKDDDEAA